MNVSTLQTNLALQIITFMSSMLTARILGVEGRGELALVLLYPQLIGGIASLGVDRAVAVRGGRGELTHPAATMVLLTLLLSAPAVSVAYLAIHLRIADTHLAYLAASYLCTIPASHCLLFMVSFVNGVGDFTRYNRMRLGTYVINLSLLTAIWADMGPSRSMLSAVVLANVAAVYGGLLICLLQARGLEGTRSTPSLQGTWADVKRVLVLALLFAAPMTLLQVSTSAYQIAIEHWLDVKSLGYFVVLVAYSRLLAPLGSAITAHVFHLGITGGEGDIARIFRLSTVACTVCVLPLWFVAPLIIPFVFGRGFSVDYEITGILLLSALLALLSDCLAEYLNGMKVVAPDVIGRSIYLFTLIIVGAFAVPRFGILAVAISMAIGDLARCAFLVRNLAKLTNQSVGTFTAIQRIDVHQTVNAFWRLASIPFRRR